MDISQDFESFLQATRNILNKDGFAQFLPTLHVGDKIIVIEGIPDSVPETDALNNVGPEHGLGSTGTLFAVLAAPDTVVAGECLAAGWHFARIQPGREGLVTSSIARPLWFRL